MSMATDEPKTYKRKTRSKSTIPGKVSKRGAGKASGKKIIPNKNVSPNKSSPEMQVNGDAAQAGVSSVAKDLPNNDKTPIKSKRSVKTKNLAKDETNDFLLRDKNELNLVQITPLQQTPPKQEIKSPNNADNSTQLPINPDCSTNIVPPAIREQQAENLTQTKKNVKTTKAKTVKKPAKSRKKKSKISKKTSDQEVITVEQQEPQSMLKSPEAQVQQQPLEAVEIKQPLEAVEIKQPLEAVEIKQPSDAVEIKQEVVEQNTTSHIHSVIEGKNLFSWIIAPVDLMTFFKDSWETTPLHIRRSMPSYYENVMSSKQIDEILRSRRLDFSKHIDITSYENGIRETHNIPGRALPPLVWDYYAHGCSIRLLNPQAFLPKVHLLCTTLQEFFGCMVGANAYLTPPGSQGFAPHYDDIEAFVLQIEGKKRWKLYSPRNSSEVLPRFSSKNFAREEIGQPVLDITLNPGEVLYFPRGVIHEAHTLEDTHSLHITISVYQKHSWADLLEMMVPAMIDKAIASDPIFRKGLPLDLPNYLGLVHSDKISTRREELLQRMKDLIMKTIEHAPLDAAVDQLCKNFQHDALPPFISAHEISCTAFGDGEVMSGNGKITRKVHLDTSVKIRLIRANILRLLAEENCLRIYFSIDNTTEYHEVESQYLEIDTDQAAAIEFLLAMYPDFIQIADIPMDNREEKLSLVQNLWEKGLLVTEKPLPTVE
uniref:Bifunctional lysine-specific demethylase and histidyl-hydroxylase n=1 Tax=Xenopsylla cheopis TaxID=163159 RepID=A0A6M2DLP5_XENCH